jgi:anti-sigma regulatory factor (Ser/Thr protein kinase)
MTPRTGSTLAATKPTNPTKPHSSYRHEAFLYRGDDEFLAGTVPFVLEGISVGQPVMVAVIEPRVELLRDALGPDAGAVEFVDMAELGRNPARIIPGWRSFLDEQCRDEQPVRGVGEPIWAGRRDAEVVECQLHEALLNLAVDPDTPMWLRCPYDVDALDPGVVEEAHRSHPILVDAESYAGSRLYGGAHHIGDFFARDLPAPTAPAEALDFGADDLLAVRDLVTLRAAATWLDGERVWELALSVHEVATNSVLSGGGSGRLSIWQEPGALVCEVRDAGRLDDPMVGRRPPPLLEESGRGLWLANQMCDLVQVRSTADGVVVRVVAWL